MGGASSVDELVCESLPESSETASCEVVFPGDAKNCSASCSWISAEAFSLLFESVDASDDALLGSGIRTGSLVFDADAALPGNSGPAEQLTNTMLEIANAMAAATQPKTLSLPCFLFSTVFMVCPSSHEPCDCLEQPPEESEYQSHRCSPSFGYVPFLMSVVSILAIAL